MDPVNISTVKWEKGILTIPAVDENSQLTGKMINTRIYGSNDKERWFQRAGKGRSFDNQGIEIDFNNDMKMTTINIIKLEFLCRVMILILV